MVPRTKLARFSSLVFLRLVLASVVYTDMIKL